MEGKCSKCTNFAELAPANLSHITGERLYQTWCKSCEKERKDKWRAANRDRHNTRSRNWVAANPEKRRAVSKAYRDTHKDAHKELRRKWRKNNPERARAHVSARRKKVKQATPSWADMRCITEVYLTAQRNGLVVDHVVPLRGKTVCGLHVHYNMQLLTSKQNAEKAARLII